MKNTKDKLKTLRELSYTYHRDRSGKKIYRDFVNIKELKAEAVKWVKEIQKDKTKSNEERASQMVWIKHFFNLTEEDLK